MALITLQTLSNYWQNVSDWVTGTNVTYKPKLLKDGRQQSVLTTTPLTGSATYTSSSFDSTASPQTSMVSAQVFADQAGTLYMDCSMDNTNWNYTQFSVAVLANTATVMPWQPPIDRYYRFRYVNGSVAQTVFRFSTSSTSDTGVQNVNASIIGSLANVSLETTATTVNQSSPFACLKEISRIANDGAYDIQFCINNAVGGAGTFTVKSGQAENHIQVQCATLNYKSIGGSSAFRALGV